MLQNKHLSIHTGCKTSATLRQIKGSSEQDDLRVWRGQAYYPLHLSVSAGKLTPFNLIFFFAPGTIAVIILLLLLLLLEYRSLLWREDKFVPSAPNKAWPGLAQQSSWADSHLLLLRSPHQLAAQQAWSAPMAAVGNVRQAQLVCRPVRPPCWAVSCTILLLMFSASSLLLEHH